MRIAGLKVVDATKKLTIHITKGDCAKGNTKDPGGCAAALAAIRTEDCTEARVHLGRTYLKVKTPSGRQHWVRYQTPEAIRTEVVSFDRGAYFTPGDYMLRPISPANRLGAARGSATGKNRHGKVKIARIKHHQVSGVRHHGAVR